MKDPWQIVIQTEDECYIPEMYYRESAERFAGLIARHPEVTGVGIFKGMADKPSKTWGKFDESKVI